MTSEGAGFPRYRPVADHAVLVEFGETISHEINDQVRRLDSALSSGPFNGFTEAIPAYASVLVDFDPIVTLTVDAIYFSCSTCRLVLRGFELIEQAGLSTTFSVEGDEEDVYNEPEYGNE